MECHAKQQAPVEFHPARAVVPVVFDKGKYPTLFSGNSYAIWITPDVAQRKYQEDIDAGLEVPPGLDAEASSILKNFVVIEAHMESVFGDMSIAYEVVGFRNVTTYLLLPDGRKISPVQTIIGTPVREEQRGALKAFQRINILIFPRRDLWEGHLNLEPDFSSVKLVFEAYHSSFTAAWPEARFDEPTTVPSEQDFIRQTQIRFTQLFTAVRRVAHIFD